MTPPAFEDVQDYCLSRRNGIDSGAVLDYYESVGWMVGKKKMKDWQAAVRTWEKNNYGNGKPTVKIESPDERAARMAREWEEQHGSDSD